MKSVLLILSLTTFFATAQETSEKISKYLTVEGDWCSGSYMLVADFNKKGGTWQWVKDGVVIPDAIENSVNLSLYGTGKYTAMYKLPNNKVILMDDYEFKTLPGTKALFEYSFFYAASAINFKNTSYGITADCTYEWDFGNGTSSTELNPIAEFKPGTYTVTLTVKDKNGCLNSYSQEVVFQY